MELAELISAAGKSGLAKPALVPPEPEKLNAISVYYNVTSYTGYVLFWMIFLLL